MIPFKNHNSSLGMTIIEVLFSIMIIGMVLSAALNLQNTSLRSVVRLSGRLMRLFAAENRLVEIHQDQMQKKEVAVSTVLETPPTTLEYTQKKLPKKSALSSLKNLKSEIVTLRFATQRGEETDSFVALIYKPEEKEKGK